MKRSQVIGTFLTLFLVVIVSSVGIPPALARPKAGNATYWYYGSLGQTFIAPPGHPNMMVEVLDIKRSSFGPHDILTLSVWVSEIDGTPINDYLPVRGVTDNAESAELLDAMFVNIPTWLGAELVEDGELEVWRRGNKLFAELKVEIPLDPPYYIPPSCIEFKGCGRAMHGTETMLLPSGYTITATLMGFNAFVTFVSHTWECPWPAGGFVALHMLLTITEP